MVFRRDLRLMKGKCQKIIGLDIDPLAAQNPSVDEFHLLEADTWPLRESSIDICVCDYVLEHVLDPQPFFSECRRVLKPGGFLGIRTTNLISYFGVIAKLIPNSAHVPILRQAKEKIREQDIFPTFYQCNTIFSLRGYLRRNRFEYAVFGYEAEPGYLAFSGFAYFLGVLHQKLAPGIFKIRYPRLCKKTALAFIPTG